MHHATGTLDSWKATPWRPSSRPTRGPWTSDDLDAFPDDWKVEILDGTLIVNAQPNLPHQLVADQLRTELAGQFSAGLRAVREIMLDLTPSQFAPGISVIRAGRAAWRAKARDPSTAVLVVEVAPTNSTVVRMVKSEKYAEAGNPGYWRVEVDPAITLVTHILRDGAYVELSRLGRG